MLKIELNDFLKCKFGIQLVPVSFVEGTWLISEMYDAALVVLAVNWLPAK